MEMDGDVPELQRVRACEDVIDCVLKRLNVDDFKAKSGISEAAFKFAFCAVFEALYPESASSVVSELELMNDDGHGFSKRVGYTTGQFYADLVFGHPTDDVDCAYSWEGPVLIELKYIPARAISFAAKQEIGDIIKRLGKDMNLRAPSEFVRKDPFHAAFCELSALYPDDIDAMVQDMIIMDGNRRTTVSKKIAADLGQLQHYMALYAKRHDVRRAYGGKCVYGKLIVLFANTIVRVSVKTHPIEPLVDATSEEEEDAEISGMLKKSHISKKGKRRQHK